MSCSVPVGSPPIRTQICRGFSPAGMREIGEHTIQGINKDAIDERKDTIREGIEHIDIYMK